MFIYRVGVLQLPSNKNATADNGALHVYLYSWPPCRRAFILVVCEKTCLLSVKYDQFLMQLRENGKHNNFGFNTWLEILTREHLPPKLCLERERRLEFSAKAAKKKTRARNHGAEKTSLSPANSDSLDSSCQFGCYMQ